MRLCQERMEDMKFKPIMHVISSVRYLIKVFENTNLIDTFKIDYVSMDNELITEIFEDKFIKYENSEVINIRTYTDPNGREWLEIHIVK